MREASNSELEEIAKPANLMIKKKYVSRVLKRLWPFKMSDIETLTLFNIVA